MFTCLTKSEAEINSWKGLWGDSLKRCNASGGRHKQLLLPQAAHLHLWPNSHRIGKVSWKPLFFFCYVLFVCTAGLSWGHKRRNNPVCKLKLSLAQQWNRMRRAWRKMKGKQAQPQDWRGQQWGATQRVPLLPKHAQPVKWVKVKSEIWHWGSKKLLSLD